MDPPVSSFVTVIIKEISTEAEEAMEMGNLYRNVLPFMAMVSLQGGNVLVMSLYKAASLRGLSYNVFVTYSYSIASLLLLPFPFFFNSSSRSKVLPPLSFSIITKLGLLALTGFLTVITGYIGINYSSPTLATAISGLLPAFALILALIFKMETLELRSSNRSRAKVLGTIVLVSGALVVTLYKGPAIKSGLLSVSVSLAYPETSWAIGGLFLTARTLLLALWYIILDQIMKVYPEEMTVMFYYNSSVTILAAVVGLYMEPNLKAWMVISDIGLLAIVCSGIISSFVVNVVCTWVLHLKGTLFVSMFKPLSIVIAVVTGVLFLGDALYLGSVIGAIIIITGFYAVIWGKSKEDMCQENSSTTNLGSSSMPRKLLVKEINMIEERRSLVSDSRV